MERPLEAVLKVGRLISAGYRASNYSFSLFGTAAGIEISRPSTIWMMGRFKPRDRVKRITHPSSRYTIRLITVSFQKGGHSHVYKRSVRERERALCDNGRANRAFLLLDGIQEALSPWARVDSVESRTV